VPVDFRKHRLAVQYERGGVFYCNQDRRLQLPLQQLEEVRKRNIAVKVSLQIADGALRFEPLVRRTADGETVMLKEPEQERDLTAPILELSGTKMHLTQGKRSAQDFSRALARAVNVRNGDVLLDTFLGLGYSAQEALELGARKVVLFEKYQEVLDLVRENPFSPSLEDARLQIELCDVSKQNAFFARLSRICAAGSSPLRFDAVILDPPKLNVMLAVYSATFLRRLLPLLSPRCRLAAYVPSGGVSPRFAAALAELVPRFESSSAFRFTHRFNDDPIFCFDRIKK